MSSGSAEVNGDLVLEDTDVGVRAGGIGSLGGAETCAVVLSIDHFGQG